jgi:glycosidase
MTDTPVDRIWWKEAVVYQVYPRSFKDTDGDGVGDLAGVIEKLDYLDDLGVDCVWLNPVYESPGVDNGYDIADYRAVQSEFGTLDDLQRLIDGLHERDMKLIMDLVVNHTSDEHEWFKRSRESRDNDYRDYYWWVESTDDEGNPVPPNDWESFFGGPAWTYDEATEEWYLHIFDTRQPDLNWENPEVRREIKEMIRWWLDKGIDGFRMDVINLLSKPPSLPDGEDPDAIVHGADKFVNGPRIHEFLGEVYDEVLADEELMTVGEMVDLTVAEAREFLYPDGDGMSMAFNFDHMRLDFGPEGRWDLDAWSLTELKATMSHWQYGLADDGWNSLYLNNHDEPRMVSRFGDEGYREKSAKLLATLTHTLQGTPFVYQGEEIGMTNYPFESLDEVRDVDTLNNIAVAREEGRVTSDEEVLRLVRHRSRDNARTPMQWTDGEHAGFTDGTPWIPVNPNHEEVNVEAARADTDSIWHYYRDLIALRGEEDVLVYGEYDLLLPAHDEIWAYTRTLGEETVLVVLNFSSGTPRFEPPADLDGRDAELIVANYEVGAERVEPYALRPWEARVYRVE